MCTRVSHVCVRLLNIVLITVNVTHGMCVCVTACVSACVCVCVCACARAHVVGISPCYARAVEPRPDGPQSWRLLSCESRLQKC